MRHWLTEVFSFFQFPATASALYRVSFWILIVLLAGCGGLLVHWSLFIWAMAALACGGLLGFLFGIPRVDQTGEVAEGSAGASLPYKQTVNTNLTEISDWLTKIIVGVSLVQMTYIPPAFQSLVVFLSGNEHNQGMVGGALVFFGVTGFLSGYLLTRMFLAPAFSAADRAANDFNRESKLLAPAPLPAEEIVTDIRRSPRDAVLVHWQQLYDKAREVISAANPNSRTTDSALQIIRQLSSLEALNAIDVETFSRLRMLRNLAVHSSNAISEEAVADYVSNATALINKLEDFRLSAIARRGSQ